MLTYLKTLKLEYLSNHWSDLTQIYKFWSGNQTESLNTSYDYNLQQKKT